MVHATAGQNLIVYAIKWSEVQGIVKCIGRYVGQGRVEVVHNGKKHVLKRQEYREGEWQACQLAYRKRKKLIERYRRKIRKLLDARYNVVYTKDDVPIARNGLSNTRNELEEMVEKEMNEPLTVE